MQNVALPLDSPCFINQELHESLKADSSSYCQTIELETEMTTSSSSDQVVSIPQDTVPKKRPLFLSVNLQIQTVMQLVEKYHLEFRNLREEYLDIQ